MRWVLVAAITFLSAEVAHSWSDPGDGRAIPVRLVNMSSQGTANTWYCDSSDALFVKMSQGAVASASTLSAGQTTSGTVLTISIANGGTLVIPSNVVKVFLMLKPTASATPFIEAASDNITSAFNGSAGLCVGPPAIANNAAASNCGEQAFDITTPATGATLFCAPGGGGGGGLILKAFYIKR